MKGNVEAVDCEFKYSGVGIAFVLAATGATLAIVLATPFDWPLRVALTTWVLAMACAAARSILALRSLRLDGSRGLRVEWKRGLEMSGTVRDGCFVAPWLTIVRWRPEGARLDRTLLVLPDMVAAEDFRKLRVLLRWM
jgi:toxin CptA